MRIGTGTLSWTRTRLVGLGLVVLASVAFGVQTYRNTAWRDRFESRVAELRSSGAPVEWADFAPLPIPDAQNGALIMRRADEWYEEHLRPGWMVSLDSEMHSENPEEYSAEERSKTRDGMRDWLRSGDPYVALLLECAAKPAFQCDMNWSAGPDEMDASLMSRSRTAMQFLHDRVRYAERGSAERREEIALILRLARQFDSVPLLALLVRWSSESTAASAIQDYLRVPGADAEACWARVGELLRTEDESERIRRAFLAERAFAIWLVRALIDGRDTQESGPFLESYKSMFGWHLRARIHEDGIEMLDLYEQIIEAVVLPPRAARAAGNALKARAWADIAAGFVALPGNVSSARVRHLAEMRVARAGLAIHAIRARTGAWSESLDAVRDMVGAEGLENPCDGERLRYEPGVVLVADGARPQDENRVTWRFSRSP